MLFWLCTHLLCFCQLLIEQGLEPLGFPLTGNSGLRSAPGPLVVPAPRVVLFVGLCQVGSTGLVDLPDPTDLAVHNWVKGLLSCQGLLDFVSPTLGSVS